MFELAARSAGFTLAWDRDAAHPEFVQLFFDAGFAVSAVGRDRAWCTSGAAGDPLDRRGQLRRVGGVSDLDVVIEDDAIDVVHDLGFVAELDRLAQAALA